MFDVAVVVVVVVVVVEGRQVWMCSLDLLVWDWEKEDHQRNSLLLFHLHLPCGFHCDRSFPRWEE